EYKEDQTRACLTSSRDNTRLAKLEMVYRTERDYKTEDMLRREYASLSNGSETQKQRLGAATWNDLTFFQWEQRRRKTIQTIVIGQRTEFQSSRVSHFQLVKSMENTYSRTHIAGGIPQEDQSTD
ncbi:MAG: hypothetical protein EZS28_031214, partial [Streblomastix strix]